MIKLLDLQYENLLIKDQINDAINNVIENSNFILGENVKIFEQKFAQYIGVKYCIGVGNGTDALELAVQVLNLPHDSEIITQANTFVATCFGITANNHSVILADIDKDTLQINLQDVESKITEKTKAIIIVHLTGSCCNMDTLLEICARHNLILIEDCAQSHGAEFNGKGLGSYGLLSTFSFYPGKNLGAFGDAGAICTNDENIYNKLCYLRNLGSIKKYHHEMLGRNSRLDTIQAAVLTVKLQYLDINNAKRRNNALLYTKYLHLISDISTIKITDNCTPVYHLYIIKCTKRDQLRQYLLENNIETGIHYPISISQLTCFNYLQQSCPVAEITSTEILTLPMYPNISNTQIELICNLIKNFYLNN